MTIFRDDIDPGPHMGDLGYSLRSQEHHRVLPPAGDHDQLIMENWAAEVPADATVIHLGDLCYKGNAYFQHMIAPHLTGTRKLLVKGNHDGGRYSFYKKSGFKLARPFSLMWGNTEVSFSHYPWGDPLAAKHDAVEERERTPIPANLLRLHGHIHNNGYTRAAFVPFLAQHVNLSVEQTKYKPINLALLLSAVIDGKVPSGAPRGGLEDEEKVSHHA